MFAKSVQMEVRGQTRVLRIEPIPEDEVVASVYLKTAAEGLLDNVYHEGRPGIRAFMDSNHDPDSILIAAYLGSPDLDTIELTGMGWINKITKVGDKKKAEVGMVFFRDYQDATLSVEFASMMLDWGIEAHGIDIYYGTIPQPNTAAIMFSRRLGFKFIAYLPMYETWGGLAVDSYICAVTREQWIESRKESHHVRTQ